MDLEIITGKPGSRPPVQLPDPGFLNAIGEEGMRKLISDHYNLLLISNVRHLFPSSQAELEKAKARASDFFIQICGGYPYYKENRGMPMMTKRHEPFAITSEARISWLECYKQLLPELKIPVELRVSFWNYLNTFSLWMINTPKSDPFQNLKIDT